MFYQLGAFYAMQCTAMYSSSHWADHLLKTNDNSIGQRWEYIKENKKVRKQESTKTRKKGKRELDQESDQEKKKTRTQPRK